MKLYICSIEGLNDAASFDAASLKIDSHRKIKLSRIKSEKDRMRSLCAGLLLNYAVAEYHCVKRDITRVSNGAEQENVEACKQVLTGLVIRELTLQELLNVEKKEYEYRQEVNGKPYIADMSGFHFSLSHSGEHVLCAWDDNEIGADLQCMDRDVKDSLAKKVMTEKEYSVYTALPKTEQKSYCYRIWSIKESYCKLTGKGLSQDFRDIETEKISFQAWLWKENYWLAVSQY